ncbi:MAG: PilZ domain-containing protein [Deltaproteobacteria bacterium]|nr:PilZ domain-containing protein [Deltaproteobacteria bacterium]
MQDKKQERRKFERVGSKGLSRPLTRAVYSSLSDVIKKKNEAGVLDLSLGGLAMEIERELMEGSKVELILPKPSGSQAQADDKLSIELGYRLLAEVRWSKKRQENGNSSKIIHGLMFLPFSIAEKRNRNGIEAIIDDFKSRNGEKDQALD